MNKTDAERRAGELYGILYWHDRGNFPVDNAEELRKEFIQLTESIANDEFPLEVNSRGNTVERSFKSDDMCGAMTENEINEDWERFYTSQDAHYFCFYISRESMKTFCYCEGDIILVTCPAVESYNAEIDDVIKFYIGHSEGIDTHEWNKFYT